MMILDYIYASIYEMTKYLGSGDRTAKAIGFYAQSFSFYIIGIYSVIFGVEKDLFYFFTLNTCLFAHSIFLLFR